MPNKMLIDASHPEETRVVVTRGNKIEDFDFESASRRQLRGNIYLAKVTRVEPSLQAAFIEYGGNRHGFLAFNEIHPDYYQIPVADRQALIEAEASEHQDEEREDEERRGGRRRRRRGSERRRRDGAEVRTGESDEAAAGEQPAGEAETGEAVDASGETAAVSTEEIGAAIAAAPDAPSDPNLAVLGEPEVTAAADAPPAPEAVEPHPDAEMPPVADHDASHEDEDDSHEDGDDEGEPDEEDDDEDEEEEAIEQVGGADALEEVPERPRVHRRHYKIQEVIKRRQILLVQVVKEERGNKGAALTTYLSLAGRYSVLMPNTGKGGGISRKITSADDRKRLKEIVQELEVPDGMGIILRTAGASRTKPEIKRDYEYLMRLWESVREFTLKSTAPALVYEEGSLIKRAIRDLYHKDIDEVVVAGEDGYREAKDFMGMIMPAQSRAVVPYRERKALFAAQGIEAQLDAMFSNQVTLKSGGYLVINPTEALVSIDVNSGRATREHNIEDTAYKTNLEAAEEIARQLRLRDLAGLIVIDFIDMEERRNDRGVEKKLKDCLKNDRARIQVGRISPFGLMEMSRQRIRTGVLESSSVPCAHCGATGFVRSTPSVALQILRSIEESLLRATSHDLVVRTRTVVALYILNQKRAHLSEIEARFGVNVIVEADDTLPGGTTFAIDRGAPSSPVARTTTGIRVDSITPVDEPIEVDPTVEYERGEEDRQDGDPAEVEARDDERTDGEPRAEAQGDDENGRRRRRRRRRRGRPNGQREDEVEAGSEEGASDEDDEVGPRDAEVEAREVEVEPRPAAADAPMAVAHPVPAELDVAAPNALTDVGADVAKPEPVAAEAASEVPAAPAEIAPPEPEPEPVHMVLTPPSDPSLPKRGGWWSRAKSALSGD